MLNSRDRFLQTMAFQPVDRLPRWEEGIREDVWAVWQTQDGPDEATFFRHHPLDRREQVEIDLNPHPRFHRNDEDDPFGRPEAHYRCDPARLPENWSFAPDQPLGISVTRGIFQTCGVEGWESLEKLMFALVETPDKIEGVMAAATEMTLWLIDRVCERVRLDYAIISEPVASFHAPVISPAHFRRLALPHYRRLVDRLRAAGVEILILRAYGNIKLMLDMLFDIGLNGLWCSHTQPSGMRYGPLRARYGPELRLIGGIDAEALLQDQAAIERELAETVPPLLTGGGYIPLLDDRVRPNVPYANYEFYCRRLEAML